MVFPEVWLLNILSSTDLLYIILMQSSPPLMWSLKLNSFFLFSRYILVFQDYWFWNWAEYSHFPNVCFFAISFIFFFWSLNAFDLCSRFCSSPTILNLSLNFHWWFDNCQTVHDIFQCWLCHGIFLVFQFWITKGAVNFISKILFLK